MNAYRKYFPELDESAVKKAILTGEMIHTRVFKGKNIFIVL